MIQCELFQNLTLVPRPSVVTSPLYINVSENLAEWTQAILSGKVSPDEGLQNASAKITTILASRRRIPESSISGTVAFGSIQCKMSHYS